MSNVEARDENEQRDMTIEFTPENTKLVNRQKAAPFRVVIANPSYNAGQIDENDNNKNQKYPELEWHVCATYGYASDADPYAKAFRYISRIGKVST